METGNHSRQRKNLLTSVGIEPTASGLDLPSLCRLSYKVAQRKSGTILDGESRRRESKGTYSVALGTQIVEQRINFSSTYSMTRLAKMALTGDPIGQPKICLKWSTWNTKKLLSRTNCRRAMIFWVDKFVFSGND